MPWIWEGWRADIVIGSGSYGYDGSQRALDGTAGWE